MGNFCLQKNHRPYFQSQNKHARLCFGSLLAFPFKQRWKKTFWFLHSQIHCFPADLVPTVMRHTSLHWLTRKNTIHQAWQLHTTHTRLEKISPQFENDDTRVVQRWLIILVFYGKAWFFFFFRCPFILHKRHLGTNQFVSFSLSVE